MDLADGRSNPSQAPHYSLRIFCTSNEHYGPSGYYPGRPAIINRNIPIEYPNNPDVLFDNSAVQFKERGLRGKAGSSPPFDLIKNPSHFVPNSTRLYNLVFGHTGPTTGKKKEMVKVSPTRWPWEAGSPAEILLPSGSCGDGDKGRAAGQAHAVEAVLDRRSVGGWWVIKKAYSQLGLTDSTETSR